jgi:phosphate transport system permease protein
LNSFTHSVESGGPTPRERNAAEAERAAGTRPSPPLFRRWISRERLAIPVMFLPWILLLGILGTLALASNFQNFGLAFWGPNWNPNPNMPSQASYGILYFLIGTGITSVFSLALAMALSLGLAIAIAIYLRGLLARVVTLFVDLLAGIPSVVYGIWGYVVLAPYFGQSVQPGLMRYFGWIPGLSAPASETNSGEGLLLAIVILTLMVVPLATAFIRDSLRALPRDLEESGLALGATRWEVTRRLNIPYARKGIGSAVLIGFGRAAGETVAVAMVIGNEVRPPDSLYTGSSTVASLLVNQFDSAFIYPSLLHALVEIALVLFLVTFAVNFFGRRLTGGAAQAFPGVPEPPGG